MTTQDTHKTITERIHVIDHIPQPYPFMAKEPHTKTTTTTQDTPNRIGTDLRHAFFNAGISAASNADATQDILVEHDNLIYCNLNFF